MIKIAEFAIDADILVPGPCKAGKNLEWSNAGLGYLSFWATSRVNLKYGSWSIAHGIKHGTSPFGPNMWGNVFENDGAAWTQTKCNFPTLSLSLNPKQALEAFVVISFEILTTFL